MTAIIACILTGTVLGVIFTYFGKWKIDNFQAIVFNYFTCLTLGSLMHGSIPFSVDFIQAPWFMYDIILGLLFISGFNIMAVTFQNFGVALTTVMQKMSLVGTVLVTILAFGESATWMKILGIALAIMAIFLVNRKEKDSVQIVLKNKWLIIFPTLVLVTSSIIEVILFYVEHSRIVGSDQMPFTTHAFGMAGVFGAVILIIGYMLGKFRFSWKNVGAGVLLGLPNYFSIYLITVILAQGFEGSFVFPLLNISVLILSAIIGWQIFKEKLSLINWLGVIMAVASIIFIASSNTI